MRITFAGKECIIIVVIWLLMGLLSVMIICVHDMRGKPYNENYFEGEIHYAMYLILMGGFAFFISIFVTIRERNEKRKSNKNFTKFIYKIANIGIKKDGNNK